MEAQKKRRPIIALVLSLLTPGLGQLYNGQIKRAAIFYLVGLSVITILILTGMLSTFWGMIFCLAIGIGFLLFVMIDALYNASRLKEIQIRFYNRWYIYLIIVLISSFVVNPLIKSSIPFKAYKMPAGSMEPTFFVGDHFIVNKTFYRNNEPERKDIVVFRYPVDPKKDFIKRVIGLPGDKIEIQGRQVIVNDQPFEENYVFISHTGSSPTKPGVLGQFGPIIVPDRKFFVLGDNRDHSYDSRFWGFVDISDLKGKALYIYWAKDSGRIGKEIR